MSDELDLAQESLDALEEALGHAFADRELLLRALTHSSFRNESSEAVEDNERFEFLGDAVLELTISHLLYEDYPDVPEGRLTELRARVVNDRRLARVARQLGIGTVLRLGRGEELTGGRDRTSVLACALEAAVGAVFLDGGFAAARAAVARVFGPVLEEVGGRPSKDPKSVLQEWAQERHRVMPRYDIVSTTGPDHATSFEAEVVVEGVVEARGEGSSKKQAQRRAAEAALGALGLDPAGRPVLPRTEALDGERGSG